MPDTINPVLVEERGHLDDCTREPHEHLLGVCHLPTARVLGKPIYMSYTSGKMAQNSESREPHLGNWILRTLYSSRHSIVRVLRSLVLPQRTLDSFLWSW